MRTTNNSSNVEVFELARQEAQRRKLNFEIHNHPEAAENKNQDLAKLKKWNWGAFLLGPLWALANKLELWAILAIVPFVNIIVVFYLGFHGNRLAFKKSKIESIDDFMAVQKNWSLCGIRLFWLGIVLGIVFLLIDALIN